MFRDRTYQRAEAPPIYTIALEWLRSRRRSDSDQVATSRDSEFEALSWRLAGPRHAHLGRRYRPAQSRQFNSAKTATCLAATTGAQDEEFDSMMKVPCGIGSEVRATADALRTLNQFFGDDSPRSE